MTHQPGYCKIEILSTYASPTQLAQTNAVVLLLKHASYQLQTHLATFFMKN